MKSLFRPLGTLFVTISLVTADHLTAAPLERVSNTTLQMPSTPPVMGYSWTNAFPGLTFINPVGMASPPGETNRLFVLEKRGRIVAITNLAAPTRTIFMNITDRVRTDDSVSDERGFLGLAFHPGYATNRYFYVFYTTTTTGTSGGLLHDALSRFEASPSDPNQGLTNSEVVLLLQRDQQDNHNGGDLHFGSDGYLYVSLGDEGGSHDSEQNSQRITKDFFSGILRLDVDKRPGSLAPNPHAAIVAPTNYAVPPDNPFVGATNFNGVNVNPVNVRTEFWAVGLRNPWRMSFDEATDQLYVGDVGQDAREEIDVIVKGGNYGWNYWEGYLQRTNSLQIPAGFVHEPPLINYTNGAGTYAVTGGRVYRGVNLSQLYGAYLYSDYGNGSVWALRHSGTNVTQNTLMFNDSGIVAFAADPVDGDILYADQAGASSLIKRITYSTNSSGTPIPPTLAQTGVFSDVSSLTVAPGIVPFDVNVPLWSDNALKQRWFSIPNTNLDLRFNPSGNWSFPTGSVWIKHFELELTNGVPASRQRLETRLIVKNAAGVYGVTYRWGDSLTNATLVPEEGLTEPFVIDDGGGILRTQVWHYPSRVECLQCHTAAGGYALGFNTAQLNRDYNHGDGPTNQLLALQLAGYFSNNVTGLHTLRRLAHPTNEAVSLEYRVRSYLDANCVQCHQPDGPAQALWDARITTPTATAGLINGPLVDNEGDTNNSVVKPGSLSQSVLLARMAQRGPGQMPPLGTLLLDTQAIALVSAWITNDLPNYQTFADWQLACFGDTNAPNAAAGADPDNDLARNGLEHLTHTDPTNSLDAWRFTIALSNNVPQMVIPQIANRAVEVQLSTNYLNPDSWLVLDLPDNAPFFPISNRTVAVKAAPVDATNRFYRVRVFEP